MEKIVSESVELNENADKPEKVSLEIDTNQSTKESVTNITASKEPCKSKVKPAEHLVEISISDEFRRKAIYLDSMLSKCMPGFDVLLPKSYTHTQVDDTDFTPIHVPVIRIMHKFWIAHLIIVYWITYFIMPNILKYDFDWQKEMKKDYSQTLNVLLALALAFMALSYFCLVFSVFQALRYNSGIHFIMFRLYKLFWIFCSASLGFYIWQALLRDEPTESLEETKTETHIPLFALLGLCFSMFIGLFSLFR